MKRFWMALLIAFGTGSFFAGVPLFAQYNPAVADVPFSFVVGNHVLPAGKYNFSEISPSSASFLVHSQTGGSLLTQLGIRRQGTPEHPSLTFARYGGEWVLVKIAPPDSLVSYAYDEKSRPQRTHIAAMISVELK